MAWLGLSKCSSSLTICPLEYSTSMSRQELMEYAVCFENLEKRKSGYAYNMFIASKTIIDSYCCQYPDRRKSYRTAHYMRINQIDATYLKKIFIIFYFLYCQLKQWLIIHYLYLCLLYTSILLEGKTQKSKSISCISKCINVFRISISSDTISIPVMS